MQPLSLTVPPTWSLHGASVTDSAANMVVAWRPVPEKVSKMVDVSYCRLKALYLWVTASLQGLQYSQSARLLAEIWCVMHEHDPCIQYLHGGSTLGHQWAQRLSKQVQGLITAIRASHRPNACLEEIAKRMGITHMLTTSNKTRFTSVHDSIQSALPIS